LNHLAGLLREHFLGFFRKLTDLIVVRQNSQLYNQNILVEGGGKMVKRNGAKNSKGAQKAKTETSSKNNHASKSKKRGWSGVFDNVTYTNGPGDNIYVFG